MGTSYKGIIIPENIIIVENKTGQGFVVPEGNDKVLQTAMNWASSMIYPDEGTWEERRDNAIKFDGIQHKYKNGHFKMRLNQSAGYSYNGGKLSFWNCDIIAPDGKTYLVGINQELLCNLLSNCTLVKGEVQEDLWLGKQQGNTGLYTEDMEDFKQAQLEVQAKEDMKSKTKKYNPGDLVGTLTKDFIYIGEYIKTKNYSYHYDYSGRSYESRIALHSSDAGVGKKYHLYLERYRVYHSDSFGYRIEVRDKKSSYTIKEPNCMKDISIDTCQKIFEEDKSYYYLIELLQFKQPMIPIEDLRNVVQACISKDVVII